MGKFGIKNIWDIKSSGSNVDTSNLVTLDGAQTITGAKTFTNTINANGITAPSGDFIFNCNDTNSFSFNNRRIKNVLNPNDANDVATKTYVDTQVSNANSQWVKIIDSVTVNTTNDTNITQARNWTDNLNNFTFQARHTYLVECKVTGVTSVMDTCFSTIIQTNNPSYDNMGQCIVYDNTATHVMIIQIHLGNTASKQNKIMYHLPSGFVKDGNLTLYAWIKDLGEFSMN